MSTLSFKYALTMKLAYTETWSSTTWIRLGMRINSAQMSNSDYNCCPLHYSLTFCIDWNNTGTNSSRIILEPTQAVRAHGYGKFHRPLSSKCEWCSMNSTVPPLLLPTVCAISRSSSCAIPIVTIFFPLPQFWSMYGSYVLLQQKYN